MRTVAVVYLPHHLKYKVFWLESTILLVLIKSLGANKAFKGCENPASVCFAEG